MEFIRNIDDINSMYVSSADNRREMLRAAIDHSPQLLSMEEFIKITDFPMPDIMELTAITQMKENIPILLTKKLIMAFGYSGEYKNQKKSLLKLIESKKYKYVVLSNKQYAQFIINKKNIDELIEKAYPPLFNVNGKSTHILIAANDLKKLMMCLNTPRSEFVRDIYLKIEEFINLYLEYQCERLKVSYEGTLRRIHNLPQNIENRKQSSIKILEHQLQEKYKIGVIYFICEEGCEITKIGYTYNLKLRLSELQVAHYKILVVKKYYFTQFPEYEEKMLHKKYAASRIRGEWFMLS